MNTSTSEAQLKTREICLTQIREWEKELDELSAENGQVVLKAMTEIDKKLVAHFENQFLIEKDRLDKFKHQIKMSNGDSSESQKQLEEFAPFYDKLRNEFAAFAESLI